MATHALNQDAEGGRKEDLYKVSPASTDTALEESGVDNTSYDHLTPWQAFWTVGWAGHAGSKVDAWLTSSAAQIGQVMLSLPRAVYLTSAAAGLPLMVAFGAISTWTIFLANSLYVEAKRRMLAEGTWYAPGTKERRQATQYFEVVGYLTHRFFGFLTLIITIIGLLSTGIAQIIACSADTYYLSDNHDKRFYALIWGGILSGVFVLIPTFKHLRILCIVGIFGTAYTAIYIWITTASHGFTNSNWTAGPTSLKSFFLGLNVMLSALGGHGMSFEIMDSMWKPSKYPKVYPFSTLFTYMVTVPHSVMVVIAYGAANATKDNVYGVLPDNGWRDSSIVLMLIHQCVAYVIYVGPVFFMAEKLFGVHSKAYPLRILARIPVAALVYFFGVAFPFYSVINAFMGAFAGTLTAFVLPAATHAWVYRKADARRKALKQPPKFIFRSWTIVQLVNVAIVVLFATIGLGFGMWSAISNFIDKVHSLGVFAKCYQCAAPVAKAAVNGTTAG